MAKVKNFIIENLHWLMVGGVAILIALFLIFGHPNEEGFIVVGGSPVEITETTTKFIEDAHKAMIVYAEANVPAIIVNENGEEQTVVAPTIDFIDGAEVPDQTSEDGQGSIHDTTTYMTYYNSVGIGTCINNSFGAQCFALANDFWANYTGGRALSSCGTGAAKGTLNCWEYNAGDEFVMVWDPTQIQPGDWVVTTGGTWGHIFMAMGYYNNGYIAGFGQNQGGGYCPLGGAATNVANINMANFGGAFRPKTYVVPDPEPTPTPEPQPGPISDCKRWTLVRGDTLGAIMKACTGTVVWGEAMNEYARSWVDESTGKTVFDGWSTYPGIGLYAGHVITKK